MTTESGGISMSWSAGRPPQPGAGDTASIRTSRPAVGAPTRDGGTPPRRSSAGGKRIAQPHESTREAGRQDGRDGERRPLLCVAGPTDHPRTADRYFPEARFRHSYGEGLALLVDGKQSSGIRQPRAHSRALARLPVRLVNPYPCCRRPLLHADGWTTEAEETPGAGRARG